MLFLFKNLKSKFLILKSNSCLGQTRTVDPYIISASLPAPAQALAASLIDKRVSKLNKFPQDTAAVVSTPLSVTIVETTAPSPKKAVASSACIPIVIPLVADKISLVASVAISV